MPYREYTDFLPYHRIVNMVAGPSEQKATHAAHRGRAIQVTNLGCPRKEFEGFA